LQTGDLFQGTRDDAFAEVAVPVPAGGPFTYRIPPFATSMVMPGSRVVVRFSGTASRRSPPRW